ncbi:unnamed protein product [Amoebophrya sp. A120]|nr:unnamed protein product [Amoebophrya sp. A120]|eukprot:GSA120T00021727001.1
MPPMSSVMDEPELPTPQKTGEEGFEPEANAGFKSPVKTPAAKATDGFFKLYKVSSFSSDLDNDYNHITQEEISNWETEYRLDNGAQEKWNRMDLEDKQRIVAHGPIQGDNASASLMARVAQLNAKKRQKYGKGGGGGRGPAILHQNGKGPYGKGFQGKGWNVPMGFKPSRSGWDGWGAEFGTDTGAGEVPVLRLKQVPYQVSAEAIHDWFGHHNRNIVGTIRIDRQNGVAQVEFRNLGMAYAAKAAKDSAPLKGHMVDIIGPMKMDENGVVGNVLEGELKDFFDHLAAEGEDTEALKTNSAEMQSKFNEWKNARKPAAAVQRPAGTHRAAYNRGMPVPDFGSPPQGKGYGGAKGSSFDDGSWGKKGGKNNWSHKNRGKGDGYNQRGGGDDYHQDHDSWGGHQQSWGGGKDGGWGKGGTNYNQDYPMSDMPGKGYGKKGNKGGQQHDHGGGGGKEGMLAAALMQLQSGGGNSAGSSWGGGNNNANSGGGDVLAGLLSGMGGGNQQQQQRPQPQQNNDDASAWLGQLLGPGAGSDNNNAGAAPNNNNNNNDWFANIIGGGDQKGGGNNWNQQQQGNNNNNWAGGNASGNNNAGQSSGGDDMSWLAGLLG